MKVKTKRTLKSIEFFQGKKLSKNSSKIKLINFYLRQEDCGKPMVMADDTCKEEDDSTRFLGMPLDKGLGLTMWTVFARGLRHFSLLCTVDVLVMTCFGLMHPPLLYGIRSWRSCAQSGLLRVFRLQTRVIIIMTKLQFRDSCIESFREFKLLTLHWLYILELFSVDLGVF